MTVLLELASERPRMGLLDQVLEWTMVCISGDAAGGGRSRQDRPG